MIRIDRSSLVIAALGAAAFVSAQLPAPLAIVALASTLSFAPGYVVARFLAPGAGRARFVMLALVLSPLIAGGLGSLLLAAGLPIAGVARIVAAVITIAVLVPAPSADERDERESLAPWIAAGLWGLLVAGLLIGNPALRWRADGLFHAAVVQQIASRGIPTEDPFFAGVRLFYFWGYHVRAALWIVLAPQVTVWAPLLAPQLAGAIASMIGVTLLAARLGASRRGQLLAASVAVFGYAPFGWVWLVARILTGSVRGVDEIHQLLQRGIEPVLAALDPGTLHVSMAFFGDKYFIPTPFALGFGAFLAFTLSLLEAVSRPRARSWILLALVIGAALFLHSVVGWACVMAGACWAAFAWWGGRKQAKSWLRQRASAYALTMIVAVVLLTPYLLATMAGNHQTIGWGLTPATLKTWLLAGALFVFAGMPWLMARASTPGDPREVWGLSLGLTLLALFLGLPLRNQSKFFNLLFLLLSAPAALQIEQWIRSAHGMRRTVYAVVLGLALLPTAGLCLWGFATESRQLADASERIPDAHETQAFEWARTNTPTNAVFVDPDENLGAAVIAGRSTLWGGDGWSGNWGQDAGALAARRRAAHEISGGSISPATRALMHTLARTLVFVHRKILPNGDPAPEPRLPSNWRRVYENEGVELFAWQADS